MVHRPERGRVRPVKVVSRPSTSSPVKGPKDRFSIVEHPIEPGVLAAPPHTHTNEDEFSFVLEGEIGVRIGDEEFRATEGGCVSKPRGVPHTFWNPGTDPATVIEIISPAGFEAYFDELEELLSTGEEPDLNELGALGERYGLTYHMELVPELVERHDVQLPGESDSYGAVHGPGAEQRDRLTPHLGGVDGRERRPRGRTGVGEVRRTRPVWRGSWERGVQEWDSNVHDRLS